MIAVRPARRHDVTDNRPARMPDLVRVTSLQLDFGREPEREPIRISADIAGYASMDELRELHDREVAAGPDMVFRLAELNVERAVEIRHPAFSSAAGIRGHGEFVTAHRLTREGFSIVVPTMFHVSPLRITVEPDYWRPPIDISSLGSPRTGLADIIIRSVRKDQR